MPNLPAMPATEFAGDSTTRDIFIRNVTYGVGDARNWMRRVVTRMLPSAGRSAVLTTDRALHTGPAPLRVTRTMFDGRGKVTGHSSTFPYDGNFAYIPHLPIIRDAGTARPLKTFDDGATVPAVYAGNPL